MVSDLTEESRGYHEIRLRSLPVLKGGAILFILDELAPSTLREAERSCLSSDFPRIVLGLDGVLAESCVLWDHFYQKAKRSTVVLAQAAAAGTQHDHDAAKLAFYEKLLSPVLLRSLTPKGPCLPKFMWFGQIGPSCGLATIHMCWHW